MRIGVLSLGLKVWGLGFGVWGLGFGIWGVGFGVWGLGVGVWGSGIRGSVELLDLDVPRFPVDPACHWLHVHLMRGEVSYQQGTHAGPSVFLR